MKKIFCLLALLVISPAVAAQETPPENTAIQGAQSHTVTSPQKCFDQLDTADAADIRKNFSKPYQECQRRVALKVEKERRAKTSPKTDTEEKAITPRNYVRVQKDSGEKPSNKGAAKQKEPDSAEKTGEKTTLAPDRRGDTRPGTKNH